ncbi:hypothetical protein [Psychroserpens sp. SPM9]|uniref:hypothetical protein n=1 Tax=Psychroserpens sp. SPM9 TaxID=2975598 RepID=UPI0021A60247|nr:hypothetical protein [Psychroserpens sp. SPM9]MDG5490429.1 hypothetical protein [Psychroserpens sp. SPM9]
MKYIIILLMLTFSITLHAQEVQKDGKTYEVKKEKIFLDGKEVTDTLSLEDKTAILKEAATISEQIQRKEAAEKLEEKKQKEAKKLEKEKKKAEKAQKKAEKEQKKAEKALKKKQKAQDNFDKATKKLETAQNKYDKLKKKGKLSPNDEQKWLDKLEKLRANVEKTKGKL